MLSRRLGRTGWMSSIVSFGGAALARASQEQADSAISLALKCGVNHFDVAPSYGEAELRMAPWMQKYRNEIFLACKTEKRTKKEASEELHRSLKRLRTNHFDLYQLHALDEMNGLKIALSPEGAIEAILEAREAGFVRFVGITGHRPPTQIEALKRFDFDSVMFPLNYVLRRHRRLENDYDPLIKLAIDKDVGRIVIKSIAKQPWVSEKHAYNTWYEPFDEQKDIDQSVWFALTQDVTTVVTPGDVGLLPKVLDSGQRFKTLDEEEQNRLVLSAEKLKPLFPR